MPEGHVIHRLAVRLDEQFAGRQVGVSSPPTRLSRVDLPQPEGPMTATNSPGATPRLTPSSARTTFGSTP